MSRAFLHLPSHELVALLRGRFAPPAWALFEQVSNGTGSHADRHADALAMSIWPSRGLEIHGFEVKSSRSDWLRELKQPEKSEPVQQFCDKWWIVAGGEGVVADGELPATWGLLVASSGGKKLVCAREAPKLDAKPATRTFIAAILRRAHESQTALMSAEFQRGIAKGAADGLPEHQRPLTILQRDHERLQERVASFEQISGLKIDNWDCGNIGKAVKLVMGSYFHAPDELEKLKKSAQHIVGVIDKELAVARQLDGLMANEEPEVRSA